MPRAYTPEEKAAKILEKKAALASSTTTTTETPVIRKASDRPQRAQRNVFNGTRGKLKISDADVNNFTNAGWTLHIFNDDPGRIDEALNAGWEFVARNEIGGVVSNVVDGNTDLGDRVRFRVGRTESGEGLFAYLMKIPTADFMEDQRAMQMRNDLIDAAIRSGKNVKPGQDASGFYDAGINMKT